MKEEAAKFIWHDVLQHSVKVLTWGFNLASIKTIENGTKFYVDGIKDGCWITIICNPDYKKFNVTITPINGNEKPLVYNNVAKENLVEVIDRSKYYKQPA